MKLYRTYAKGESQQNIWSTSQAAAASVRRRLYDAGYKRSDVVTEEAEVPTKKQPLCDWLNQHAK